MKETLEALLAGRILDTEYAEKLMTRLLSGEFGESQIAGFLMALRARGESASELTGFVRAMRRHGTPLKLNEPEAVDCCGTGGDGSGSFNISTAAGLIAAAAGAKVAKHGNRSVSSRCGSADLLEGCGVRIEASPEEVRADFQRHGICFMFAPIFHPAIKEAMPARRALGVRTVFNMLGPLANPAGVTRQLLGVYSGDVLPLFAETLQELKTEHALVVHSLDGLDEISCSAPTEVIEVRDGALRSYQITPEEMGLTTMPAEAQLGGSPEKNIATFRLLLAGEPVAPLSATLANAGATLYVAGKAESIREGVELAQKAVKNGVARELLFAWTEGRVNS